MPSLSQGPCSLQEFLALCRFSARLEHHLSGIATDASVEEDEEGGYRVTFDAKGGSHVTLHASEDGVSIRLGQGELPELTREVYEQLNANRLRWRQQQGIPEPDLDELSLPPGII